MSDFFHRTHFGKHWFIATISVLTTKFWQQNNQLRFNFYSRSDGETPVLNLLYFEDGYFIRFNWKYEYSNRWNSIIKFSHYSHSLHQRYQVNETCPYISATKIKVYRLSLVWFGFFVQWHINLRRLFSTKSILGEEQ